MRCFVGFYGLTRSLRYTAPSIHCCIYEPLRQAGIETIRAGHFNLPAAITNPRSGEFNLKPNRAEVALLDLDLCWIEPQDDAVIQVELEVAEAFGDAIGDGGRSLANLCHQLRSLQRLWSLLHLQGVVEDDLVLLLRPDLLYLDPLEPAEHLTPLREGATDLIVPSWQDWGGLNDRLAFCTRRAAEALASRMAWFIDACADLGGMHAECFLKYVVRRTGLRVQQTALRAVRVRANGSIAGNDAILLVGRAAA
ncbi:MAG: hypothetical protein JO122_09110 [Acetobacteraceae bacterium]|nr:hypothetical protein [Acetobacteraceae bacterium]